MRLKRFIGKNTLVFDIDDVRAVLIYKGSSVPRMNIGFASREDLVVYRQDTPELFRQLVEWVEMRDWSEIDTCEVNLRGLSATHVIKAIEEEVGRA